MIPKNLEIEDQIKNETPTTNRFSMVIIWFAISTTVCFNILYLSPIFLLIQIQLMRLLVRLLVGKL